MCVLQDYKNPESMPHWVLANKMKKRDGFAASPGDRVPYVVITGAEKSIMNRAEDPTYAEKNGLHIDCEYYIKQQLKNPLENIMSVVEDVSDVSTEADRIMYRKRNKTQSITHFFAKKPKA